MYGLKQAGILAKYLLAEQLHNHEYYQVRCKPGLWQYVWINISFTLFVDNYGIGYVGLKHSNHIMIALKIYDENITTDWEGKICCGITMKYNYTKRYVDISMTGYVKKVLHQFDHKTPNKPQHQPYTAS